MLRIVLSILLLFPAQALAGGYGSYGYGSYYKPSYGYGYSSPSYKYWYGGVWNVDGRYYSPGWYPYYEQTYKPFYIYQPVAFSTYVPASLVTKPLAAIESATAVQATGVGVAAIPAIPTVSLGTLAVTAPAQPPSALNQIAASLKVLSDRLTKVEAAMVAPAPAPLPPVPKAKPRAETPANRSDQVAALVERGKSVFVASCSKCHAKGDDAKPQLFNGQEPRLDAQLLSDCKDAILEGSMPPPDPDAKGPVLSQQDGQALMAYFIALGKANRKKPAAK